MTGDPVWHNDYLTISPQYHHPHITAVTTSLKCNCSETTVSLGPDSFNVGALIVTHTISGAPYYDYSIMGPKSYSNYPGPYIKLGLLQELLANIEAVPAGPAAAQRCRGTA